MLDNIFYFFTFNLFSVRNNNRKRGSTIQFGNLFEWQQKAYNRLKVSIPVQIEQAQTFVYLSDIDPQPFFAQ